MSKFINLLISLGVLAVVSYALFNRAQNVGSIQKEITPISSPIIFPTSTPDPIVEKDNCPMATEPKPFGGRSRSEVLQIAIKEGLDFEGIAQVAATFDIVCFGSTDVEIPLNQVNEIITEPDVIQIPTVQQVPAEPFTDEWNRKRREECQDKVAEYNSCLAEHNAEMTKYNTCLIENQGNKYNFCYKPYESCSKPTCAY